MFRFSGGLNGVSTKFYIGQAYADFAQYGLLLEGAGSNGLVDSLTSQGQAWGSAGTPVAGANGVYLSAPNCAVQIGNLPCDIAQDNAIRIDQYGNRLDINALRCVTYNTQNNNSPAILIADSGTNAANAVYLGGPPNLSGVYVGPLRNARNGILTMGAPAGTVASPGLSVGSTNSGLYQPSSTTLATSVAGIEVLRATSSGGVTLGAAPGNHALEVATPASAANRVLVSGAVTGSAPSIAAQGSDTNVALSLAGKGSGAVQASANGGLALKVDAAAASPVNYLGARAAATGGTPLLYSAGTDANVDLQLTAQGSGLVRAVTAPGADSSTAIATTAWLTAKLGANGGIATLDGSGKVPTAQIPASLLGAVVYQGTWNASTNTPALASGVGTKGYAYKVSVAGTTTLDGVGAWVVGDWVIFDGTAWDKIDGNPSEVTSVAGRTGAVTLAVADISGAAPLASPSFTGSVTLPSWTTAGRLASPAAGTVGYNTDLARFDHYTGAGWKQLVRLDGDTMTGALLANSAGGGNVARVAGAAAGSPVVIGVDPSSADPNLGVVIGNPLGTGGVSLQPPDSAYLFVSATIAAGGTGYVVGDVLTLSGGTTGGTFPAAAKAKVSAVSSGVVTAVTMQAQGSYSAAPGSPVSTTGGSGSGCTLTVTWGRNPGPLGANAVDLQTYRSAATQAASGAYSEVLGGQNNTASGANSELLGGLSSTASGTNAIAGGSSAQATGNTAVALGSGVVANGNYSIALGRSSSAHGLTGALVRSAGAIASTGDAQSGEYILSGRSTGGAAVRLTADGSSAGSANVANLPNNTAWSTTLVVTARDQTTGGSYHWAWNYLYLNRGASAATVTMTTSGPSFSSLGTQTGTPASGSLSYNPDTTNGGLNLTFTPVSGNTNTWDIVAVLRTAEVQ